MRVLFVNRYFAPDQSATARMLHGVAAGLQQRGFEVHVVTSRQTIDAPGANLSVAETVNGIHVQRICTTRFGQQRLALRVFDYLSFYWSARRALKKTLRAGDVVVAKTDPPLLGAALSNTLQQHRALLVNWLQDLFPDLAVALGILPADGLFANKLNQLRNNALAAAAANVVLDEQMARLVEPAVAPKSNVRVIPNWADGRRIVATPARERTGELTLMYAGNLGRAHDFDTVLAALADPRLESGVRLVFVGTGAQHRRVQQHCERAGLRQKVEFREPVTDPALAELLAAADAHLVTSKPAAEGKVVPSKLYGAMAAGRPVVYVGGEAAPTSVLISEHDFGVGIAAGDVRGLVDALASLRDNPQRAAEMGARARSLFEQRFTLELAVEAWAHLIETLARKP